MQSRSPFLTGFHKLFGGRRPASMIEKLLGLRREVDVQQASFKGTVDRLATWTWAIWLAPTQRQATELTAQMLQSIAADEVPHRPSRQEHPNSRPHGPAPSQHAARPFRGRCVRLATLASLRGPERGVQDQVERLLQNQLYTPQRES